MRKEILLFTFSLLILGMLVNIPLILAQNGNSENAQPNLISGGDEAEIEDEEQICCHIFGYGANMQKVNSQYQLMNKGECVVSENFVGGGREIVSAVRCQAGYTEKVQEAIQNRNRLRLNQSEVPENCTKTGSVLKCNVEGGREMTVTAGSSGNIIVQVKGINMTTSVTLYHHSGEIYGEFSNNETKPIRYLPDQLKERIRERTRARLNNTNITLNENGEYEYEAEKEARFLGLFKVKERMHWEIDPETGEILKENTPWWGFLASDVEEESSE
jgi:hypothetical protein